jgi:prophage antirepressor-like protein
MNNALCNLEFEGRGIRIRVDEAGNPWWVARDVCDCLGHSNPSMAMQRLDEDEKGLSNVYTPGGPQEMATINEAGLYSLILTSRSPDAHRFKRWVTHEVLPSLRKHGSYHVPSTSNSLVAQATMLLELARQQEAQAKEVAHTRHLAESAERHAKAALDVQTSNFGHYSVLAWCRLHGLGLSRGEAMAHGRRLTILSHERGLSVGRVNDTRFGVVNTYCEELLGEYFGTMKSGVC